MNKQQKWIDNHPLLWIVMNKVGDAIDFAAKVSAVLLFIRLIELAYLALR